MKEGWYAKRRDTKNRRLPMRAHYIRDGSRPICHPERTWPDEDLLPEQDAKFGRCGACERRLRRERPSVTPPVEVGNIYELWTQTVERDRKEGKDVQPRRYVVEYVRPDTAVVRRCNSEGRPVSYAMAHTIPIDRIRRIWTLAGKSTVDYVAVLRRIRDGSCKEGA